MSKRHMCVLRNDAIPPRDHTGVTSDVARRCAEHNAGRCSHTARYGPWSIDVVIEFTDERRAVAIQSVSGIVLARPARRRRCTMLTATAVTISTIVAVTAELIDSASQPITDARPHSTHVQPARR